MIKNFKEFYCDEYIVRESDEILEIIKDPSIKPISIESISISLLMGVLIILMFYLYALWSLFDTLIFFLILLIMLGPFPIGYFFYYRYVKIKWIFDKKSKSIKLQRINPSFKRQKSLKIIEVESLIFDPHMDFATNLCIYFSTSGHYNFKILEGSRDVCIIIGKFISNFLKIPFYKYYKGTYTVIT